MGSQEDNMATEVKKQQAVCCVHGVSWKPARQETEDGDTKNLRICIP